MLYSADKALVRRLLAGDEEAFDAFFDEYAPRLYRFALARLGQDADTAEDVVQSALYKAVAKLATYRGEASLLTWLCSFCFYEITAHYRRHKRKPHQVELLEEDPEVATALDLLRANATDRPDDVALRRELARLVQVTLDYLPARYGDVLEWKYMEGLTMKEIAERFQTTPTAVQSLLSRAREAFRNAFSTAVADPRGTGP